MKQIIARAKEDKQRIVLPEGTEPRTLTAADKLIKDGVACPILLGNKTEILSLAKEFGLANIEKAEIINPAESDKRASYVDLLVELRKSKGLTREEAEELVNNPLYYGCLMVKAHDADGFVAGAINYTKDVLRPALQIIKTKPGIKCVSGAFLLFTKSQYGDNGFVLVADVAVTPRPSAQEMAEIAVCSAETARDVCGIDPRVALLSYSTMGSGKGDDVDKVVEATRIAKEMAPNLAIDGELQADAALVEKVGKLKAPNSKVAGRANVLIFPSLEVGNVAYKMVERLGGATTIGPVFQGMAAPVNDLSRGCAAEDIYNLIAMTANQAISLKKAQSK